MRGEALRKAATLIRDERHRQSGQVRAAFGRRRSRDPQRRQGAQRRRECDIRGGERGQR